MKRFYFISLSALLMLVFFVGFVTYMNLSGKSKEINVAKDANTTLKPTPLPTEIPWIVSLTDAEKSILVTQPSASASESEKIAFGQLVVKEAKKGELVNISEFCKPSPLVLSPNGLGVKFKNNDTNAHQLIFGVKERYSINPGETRTISLGEDRKGKVISYSCQGFGRVGFIIVPK